MKVWLAFWNDKPNTAHPDWVSGDCILVYDHKPSGRETLFTWLSVDVADSDEAQNLYGRDGGFPRARLDVDTLKASVDPATATKIDNIAKAEPMDETDVIPHLDKMTVWDACTDVNAEKVPAELP